MINDFLRIDWAGPCPVGQEHCFVVLCIWDFRREDSGWLGIASVNICLAQDPDFSSVDDLQIFYSIREYVSLLV